MQGAIDAAFMQTNPLHWFLNPNDVQFLTFRVHRDRLVEDTLMHLGRCAYNELKKPLKVSLFNDYIFMYKIE